MTKSEVELIILSVKVDGQDAINMKIYKDGTTCRYGAGGLPQLGILGVSYFKSPKFFDPLLLKVPDEIITQPLVYEEETPNGYLEYFVGFCGVSKNGDTGERADWDKTTFVCIKLDHQSNFRHPLLGVLDNLIMDAAELTNEWYFDIIMNSRYAAFSSSLPKDSITAQPKTEEEIHTNYENYINQMMASARNWDMSGFGKNKTYEINKEIYKGFIQQDKQSFSINFIPLGNNLDVKPTDQKPWWKMW